MSENFNLDDYVTVTERIQIFWKTYPEGRIKTVMVSLDPSDSAARMAVIKAWVWKQAGSDRADSTGYAKEREGTRGANEKAFLENCETSAIGRALANLNIGVSKKRPSREEMEGVQAVTQEHESNLKLLQKYAASLAEDTPIRSKLRDDWKILVHNPLEVLKLVQSFNLHSTETEVEPVT